LKINFTLINKQAKPRLCEF